MRLERLRVRDFRNIPKAEFTFSEGLNLITGANGQGKTNPLEAIGILTTGRSFRRASPLMMRRHSQEGFLLQGHGQAGNLVHKLDFFGIGGRQSARINGKSLASLSAMKEALAAVIFTPEVLRLVRDGPGLRRNYLDWMIFSRHPRHAQLARDHGQALKARNHLLRRGRYTEGEMAAWEEQLALIGARIALQRRAMVERLQPVMQPHLEAMNLIGHRYEARLSCQLERMNAPWQEEAQAAQLYRRMLAEGRSRDQRHGATGAGPHRDDLLFLIDGRPLHRYASQGQQKRFALTLKLAEATLLQEARGAAPILILDDPASELDASAVAQLMAVLAALGGQLFISACDAGSIPWPEDALSTTFRVESGMFEVVD